MNLKHTLSLACAVLAAPALLNAQPTTAVVGEAAPAFSLEDEAGATHTLAQYEGQVVVLEWTNPECPYVVRHYDADTMENLATDYGGQDVVWLAVNSSHFNTADDSSTWKGAEGFDYSTLLDVDGSVGHAYGARTTPHMFVVAADGTLAYAGAVDDNPRGNSENVTNYIDGAVTALLAGEAVSPSSTEPYGCSVKYD
ncbi:MAG: peroxiredoxin [Bradymonadia bacterium]|jgi:peroxiredoxin